MDLYRCPALPERGNYMKKWIIGKPDPAITAALQQGSDLSELSCMVLAAQGCMTIRDAAERLGCSELSDPFLLCDMQEAVDAVNAAIEQNERICVYGDYDCDGVIATVILYSYLYDIGADVTWRIPERREGYGLNEQAVREMHEDGVSLIITVDNGISAVAEAKLIRELGMELVVTDHHQPGSTLPEALAVVDAHRTDNFSPFHLYCGAGIALLLIAALNEGDTDMALEQFGDLAAIATVADVVSLTGENRLLVQRGLEYLKNTERPGLRSLIEVSGLAGKTVDATQIAFVLAPRINAAGRLDSPRSAVELLLEEDPVRAKTLAERLNAINASRKQEEDAILGSVQEKLAEEPSLLYERVMLFAGEGWNAGIIGITAARLMERYGKPCFMISLHDGIGHGSVRSFGGFSVFACLTACADLLEKFGGHPAAGGFTIKEENIPAFRERIQAYAAKEHPEMPVPELRAACVLRPEFLTPDAVESLSQLAPFGCDNPEPFFLLENAVIRQVLPLSQGVHTKLQCETGGRLCDVLLFRRSPEETGLHKGDVCHLMVKLQAGEFRGMPQVSIIAQDVRLSGIRQGSLIAARQAYESFRRSEPLKPEVCRALCPSRDTCVTVFKCLSEQGSSIEHLAVRLYGAGINYGRSRICLDIFAELGLAQIDEVTGIVKRMPGQDKVDLQSSKILTDLQHRSEEVLV